MPGTLYAVSHLISSYIQEVRAVIIRFCGWGNWDQGDRALALDHTDGEQGGQPDDRLSDLTTVLYSQSSIFLGSILLNLPTCSSLPTC